MARILYVEDDIKLSALIRDYLSLHGFEVYCLHRGDQVLPWLARQQADLLLLDLMLPGLDGLEVCRQLRAQQTLPILMLTARGNDIDHVLGLELGADDYIIKPVEPRVLVARIKAVLRRQTGAGSEVLRLGQLNLDRVARRATLGQLELELTSSEFELLYLLTSKAGTVLSRDDIINHLRGIDFDGHDRSADVLVSRLRRKLGDDPREPRCIKTVWNRGYLLLPPEEQR